MNNGYRVTSRCIRRQKLHHSHLKIFVRDRVLCFSTSQSYALILKRVKDAEPIRQVHSQIITLNLSKNVVLCNRLTNAYASCGLTEQARLIFSRISKKNLVSWTIFVSGLVKNGLLWEAVQVFCDMVLHQVRPNEITIASVLPAFGKLRFFLMGKAVHCYWIRHVLGGNVFVETGLVDMYATFGCMNLARHVFVSMPMRSVVSWNSIISGYSENGFCEEALLMLNWMRREGFTVDNFTVMGLTKLGDSRVMSAVHCLITKCGYEHDHLLKTALMERYINYRFIDDADRLFGEIVKKDIITWTLMLRGLSKSRDWKRTIEHFNKMACEEGFSLDSISFTTILSGCSTSGALHEGTRIHGLVVKSGFEADVFVGSSLIDMYGNCVRVNDARKYFEKMKEKDVACWNALISGYGMMGHGNYAINLYLKMKTSGLSPNESTLVSVLCACSHSGLVDQALQIFADMTKDSNIFPNSKHYACLIDLLGRAGRLSEAYSLTKKMHLRLNEVYGSLLNACKLHKNFELGTEISRELLQSKPDDAGYYILASNMHALSGDFVHARTTRTLLKSNNLKKTPGISSIEVDGVMFTFMASQMDHPHYIEIKRFLECMILRIEAAGYEPDLSSVFQDVTDDVKKDILFHHSEKLAIAFGLMRTKPDAIVRITKNLRICDDCHSASKFVSKVYDRNLVIKDANRFHVFKDGVCSCRDYW